MNPESLERLKKILGEEFGPEELERALEEFPDLMEFSAAATESLAFLKDRELPALSPQFTANLAGRLEGGSWWKRLTAPWPLRLGLGSALAALLLAAVYLAGPWTRGPGPGTPDKWVETGKEQKIYQVGFSLSAPTAADVKILGDFNQWNETSLEKDDSGTFRISMTLPEGTYAYGFLVDGKEWVTDPTAHGFVPDGFGKINSVINL